MTAYLSTVATPVGPFTVVATEYDDIPTVIASGWTADPDDLLPLIAPALRPDTPRTAPRIDGITDAVTAYHAGEVEAVDAIPVAQRSGPFLEHAWQVLRQVPAGEPVTYQEFAARAGRPRAIRAAGSACSRNAAALFVPCHRVLPSGNGNSGARGGANGSFTSRQVGGFRWGPEVKQWLLRHEAARHEGIRQKAVQQEELQDAAGRT